MENDVYIRKMGNTHFWVFTKDLGRHPERKNQGSLTVPETVKVRKNSLTFGKKYYRESGF